MDGTIFSQNGIALTERGRVAVNGDTLETSMKDVYVIGDANRGPATVVEAIRDARIVADQIVGPYRYQIPAEAVQCPGACRDKQGKLAWYDDAGKESGRCLGCSSVCECCVQVCPNRANVAICTEGLAMPQILHVDRMCNECGNCAVFCPYDSAPYLEKLTLFATEAEFDGSKNRGFLPLGGGRYKLRLDNVRTVTPGKDSIDADVERIIRAVEKDYAYLM